MFLTFHSSHRPTGNFQHDSVERKTSWNQNWCHHCDAYQRVARKKVWREEVGFRGILVNQVIRNSNQPELMSFQFWGQIRSSIPCSRKRTWCRFHCSSQRSSCVWMDSYQCTHQHCIWRFVWHRFFRSNFSNELVELDGSSTPAQRAAAEAIFTTTNITYQTSLYSNAEHGFAVRTNLTIPEKKFAQESAYFQAVRFFDFYL